MEKEASRCVSYEEEDTCVSCEEEDTFGKGGKMSVRVLAVHSH